MIKAFNLTKKFDSFTALDELNMHVKKGSIYGLIGANGAGKTTLIRHIAGVLKQDSGDVFVDDTQIYENAAAKQNLFYIPDDFFFFPSYTVKDMKNFYKTLYPTWSEERFNSLEKAFPIEENRRIQHLSKGMQKQIAFRLAISAMPSVLILDEPVDGLDPVMRRKVWNLILQDVSERETTVLISSHNLRELEDVCDCVGIMYKGKVVLERALDDAKSNIHKLQVAFDKDTDFSLIEELNPLHISHIGSVTLMIVRGSQDKIMDNIKKYSPVICDILPLTLEEIFIYELGGMGYEIKDIVL